MHSQEAKYTERIDKVRILNSIAFPELGPGHFKALQSHPAEHPNYERVNRALASHFALAMWYGYVQEQKSTEVLARALEADASRRIVQLSFTGCAHFGDAELLVLMSHLPDVRVLRLDLCFTGLETLDSFVSTSGSGLPDMEAGRAARAVPGLRCLAELTLRLTGSERLRSVAGLSEALEDMRLAYLELWPGV